MVFESDFDTTLPSVDDLEEMEEWSPGMALGEQPSPAPGRVISCFNASATLCGCSSSVPYLTLILSFIVGIFGKVMQWLYAIRPVASRQAQAAILESMLDKWYLDLPDHLRYEMPCRSETLKKTKRPLPNVLALHMQYWTVVLILHRPLCVANFFSSFLRVIEFYSPPPALHIC